MSRVGQKPVTVPSGVDVTVGGSRVTVKGPKGELFLEIPTLLGVKVEGGKIVVTRKDESKDSNRLHGLTRSLIANTVEGVANGYKKELEIQGVGFKAAIQGQDLTLFLGFSVPVKYTVPLEIKLAIDAGTQITITGADKQMVGDVTARVRSFFPAEVYKGKGIRYKGEHVRRKVGKTVA